jgi:hypothetical protein
MNLETVRHIAEILENSWGRESSPDGTYSIKHDLQGDKLTLKFTTVVHFADEAGLRPQIEVASNQATQLLDAKIAILKSSYREASGETLRLEDLGGTDDVDLIMPVGPRKVAYYRYNHSFAVQE